MWWCLLLGGDSGDDCRGCCLWGCAVCVAVLSVGLCCLCGGAVCVAVLSVGRSCLCGGADSGTVLTSDCRAMLYTCRFCWDASLSHAAGE